MKGSMDTASEGTAGSITVAVTPEYFYTIEISKYCAKVFANWDPDPHSCEEHTDYTGSWPVFTSDQKDFKSLTFRSLLAYGLLDFQDNAWEIIDKDYELMENVEWLWELCMEDMR